MMKHVLLLISCFFLLNGSFLSQEVKVVHNVEKNLSKNEYKVTSVFSGVKNADFAKVRFVIPDGINVISPASGGHVAKKEENGISFYALSVSEKGVTTVFYVQPDKNDEISIGVQFIYAVGEDKIKPSLEKLVISTSEEYIAYEGETPEDNSFEIKEIKSNTLNDGNGVVNSKGIFSIQLLSLREYSDERVMKFCLEHKLNSGNLIKRSVDGITKISIGKYPTKEKAIDARKTMILNDAVLNDAFIVHIE